MESPINFGNVSLTFASAYCPRIDGITAPIPGAFTVYTKVCEKLHRNLSLSGVIRCLFPFALERNARKRIRSSKIRRIYRHNDRTVGVSFPSLAWLLIPFTASRPGSEDALTIYPPGHIQKEYTPRLSFVL